MANYRLKYTAWPGALSEQETKIPAGSSQLYLFDQSDAPTQWDRLRDLAWISMMERSMQSGFQEYWGHVSTLRGLPTATDSKAKQNGASSSHIKIRLPPKSTS